MHQLRSKLKEHAQIVSKTSVKKENYKYQNYIELVLDLGIFRNKIGKIPRRIASKSLNCYKNCFDAIAFLPELNYCEGYVLLKSYSCFFKHCWAIDEQEKIIDFTGIKGIEYIGVIFDNSWAVQMANKKYLSKILLSHCGLFDRDYIDDFSLLKNGPPKEALRQVQPAMEIEQLSLL